MSPCLELAPVVGFVLNSLGIDSGRSLINAMGLLMGTAAVESGCEHRIQMDNGPARGLWQMERETHDDIWINFLNARPPVAHKVALFGTEAFRDQKTLFPKFEQITGNSWYACAMARMHYLRVKDPIPSFEDPEAIGRYWKTFYNTAGGGGDVDTFVKKYLPMVEHIRIIAQGVGHSH